MSTRRRAGQATDLVRHGENGWLAEVDDVEALVEATAGVAALAADALTPVLREGRATAEANSYESLRPRWSELLRGFVAMPE